MLGINAEIVLFGLIVGVLVGLTGIGGGSLMTPLMIIVLGVAPVTAVGTDLAYGAITKTFGGLNHLRRGTVDRTVVRWLALGGVPGTLIGAISVTRLHSAYGKSFEHVLVACIAGALLIVTTVVLVRSLLLTHLNARESHTFQFTARSKGASLVLGFVLGAILGLTSVGTGALIGVAMLVIFRLTPQRVAGTSVFLGAMLLWVAGIVYMITGTANLSLMGNLLIGSIPGVWIGSQLVHHVPAQALRVTLGAVLLGSSLATLSKAGVKLPASLIIGAPIAVGLLGYLMHRLRPTSGEPAIPAQPTAAATEPAAAAGQTEAVKTAAQAKPPAPALGGPALAASAAVLRTEEQ